MGEKRSRSLIKTVSWRAIAALVTIIVAFVLTGNLIISLSIGSIDTIIKLFVYYFHERGWNKISFGRDD